MAYRGSLIGTLEIETNDAGPAYQSRIVLGVRRHLPKPCMFDQEAQAGLNKPIPHLVVSTMDL